MSIEGLPDDEARDIVGDEILQESQGIRPFDLKLTHVADVKESGVGAYGLVLFQNTAVLYRHLPAAKLDETCS